MFDFIKNRKIWYIISGVIILVGIVSLCVQGLNWGIDFTGGSETIVKFAEPVDISMVREAVDSTGISNSVNGVADTTATANAGQENNFTTFVINTRDLQQSEELDEAVILSDALSTVGENEQLSQQTVGSVIGKELTRNAILALLLAMVLMVVYISFRFEFKQGLATIFALIYDVLVVISAFSLFQLEVDSAFVAAILTVVGYSINNSIIVFDRVRENLNNAKRESSLASLVNRSIWQTLVRSINTSLVVALVLVCLLVIGGSTTKIFVLAMLIGVISGCYTSVCLAGSFWIDLKPTHKAGKKRQSYRVKRA